jgi:dienelactone hydrolase
MKGFVVYDDATEAKRPRIVMVHEWWGITKHMHDEARKLAEQGYTAFIADTYGDGKTVDNPTAQSSKRPCANRESSNRRVRFIQVLALTEADVERTEAAALAATKALAAM